MLNNINWTNTNKLECCVDRCTIYFSNDNINIPLLVCYTATQNTVDKVRHIVLDVKAKSEECFPVKSQYKALQIHVTH